MPSRFFRMARDCRKSIPTGSPRTSIPLRLIQSSSESTIHKTRIGFADQIPAIWRNPPFVFRYSKRARRGRWPRYDRAFDSVFACLRQTPPFDKGIWEGGIQSIADKLVTEWPYAQEWAIHPWIAGADTVETGSEHTGFKRPGSILPYVSDFF